MEKDIVIEQLRNQLKQLRSKMAAVEEEQAADTAPLQGLLNQLGELKVRVCFVSVELLCRLFCVAVCPFHGRRLVADGVELRRMCERATAPLI